ncbi:MAG: hypothetical protein WC832_04175 [Anaerolineales bacterium]
MIICAIFRSGKYPPVKKGVLYLTLLGVGLIVFIPIAWMYQKMKLGMGVDVAQITLTFAMVIFLGMVLAGMGLAYFIDSTIRRRRFIFRTPQPGGWVDALIRVWGFELIDEQLESPAISAAAQTLEADEVLAILNKPRRRGRKPTYSIDRWKRIVLKWENRDTLRDTMTLADLLAEEFGTHADGSPGMTEQSYYDWRDKVFAELKNEAEAIKSSGKITRGKM